MSWSLQISNGDLTFNGADMTTVQGAEKLVQDLACCILEPMGTDSMHPSYGSIIDGGTSPDGTFNQGIIGSRNNSFAATYVDNEISRICHQYQAQQQARFTADVAVYGTSTLTASEALLGVQGVNATADQDRLLVTATLQTGSGDLPINIPMTTS
jgi:hypothetical protein